MKMNKTILKNGMHVITRNGNEYVIMSNAESTRQMHTNKMIGLNIHTNGFMRIDNYDDDLTLESNHDYDIMFIYEPHFYKYILSSILTDRDNFDLSNFDLIAER